MLPQAAPRFCRLRWVEERDQTKDCAVRSALLGAVPSRGLYLERPPPKRVHRHKDKAVAGTLLVHSW
jgi:hypothetical protein